MALLDDIEPLKQSALADLKTAPDLAALEQTKGAWLGPNGKFTVLMKQLGTLSKEEKPAAGKAINAAKVELEAALGERRGELELKAALPKEPTDFTLPGRRRALGKFRMRVQPRAHRRPADRKWILWVFTLFVVANIVLIIVGTFFRGPGWALVPPWVHVSGGVE